VTEVHWRIIANLGFKFRSHFTAHCGRRAGRAARRAACGRIISRHAIAMVLGLSFIFQLLPISVNKGVRVADCVCVCLCVCVCVVQLTATRARLTTEDVASTPTALRTNTEIATAYVIRAILETASIAILLVIAVPSWPIIIQLHSRPLKGGRPGARHFSVGRAMSFLTANTARLEGPSRFSDSQHNIADQIFS